uniref:Uncharacterized protein n=1 Tax=Picea glauca TaxID=3330 RepID=A0A124GNR3_PICGL|nr:hypothetical protein ABT39_MTgene2867 [Picea glauca]QHR87611.1 hypothetical protein Q903MT_gene1622 [Picea sitchensis]
MIPKMWVVGSEKKELPRVVSLVVSGCVNIQPAIGRSSWFRMFPYGIALECHPSSLCLMFGRIICLWSSSPHL